MSPPIIVYVFPDPVWPYAITCDDGQLSAALMPSVELRLLAIRTELIHKALDGTLLLDVSEFLFNELTVKDM